MSLRLKPIVITSLFLPLTWACSSNTKPIEHATVTTPSPVDTIAVRKARQQFRVHYNTPVDLDSTDFYYQPISVVTQEQQSKSRTFSSGSYESDADEHYGIEGTCYNVLFFQKSTLSEHELLPHGRFVITHIDDAKKPDVRWPYIFYTITKADTNADGEQDNDDATALFVSDRSGHQLRQLTPDGTHLEGKMIIAKNSLMLVEVRPDVNHDHDFTHTDGTYWLRFNLSKLTSPPVRQPTASRTETLQAQMLERQSRLTK